MEKPDKTEEATKPITGRMAAVKPEAAKPEAAKPEAAKPVRSADEAGPSAPSDPEHPLNNPGSSA